MQDCFRAHPDVYGAELSDDPEDDEEYQSSLGGAGDAAAAEANPLDLAPDNHTFASPEFQDTTASPPPPPSGSVKTSTKKASSSTGEKVADSSINPSSERAKTGDAKAAKAQVERDHGVSKDTGSDDRIPSSSSSPSPSPSSSSSSSSQAATDRAKAAKKQVESDHGISRDTGSPAQGNTADTAKEAEKSEFEEDVIPKPWHDATGDVPKKEETKPAKGDAVSERK